MFWPKLDAEPDALEFLKQQPYAHRGLHDAAAGIPENSLAAFDRAIAAGVGIELDVRLTRDGDVIVFHDVLLDRLTDATGPVYARNRDSLRKIHIAGTDNRIMTLHDTLIHIGGRVPVLIEAKTDGIPQYQPVCFAIRRALEGYQSPAAVMSFDPRLTGWFFRHHPKVVRGLVMTEEDRKPLSRWNLRKRIKRQLVISHSHPHFLAYDIARLPSDVTAQARMRKRPVLTWTVRTHDQHVLAAANADEVIFEGRVPSARSGPRVAART